MASLSLPRVLHPRKTSLEIERENFTKSQQQALQKAINGVEAPIKTKHVRSAIIGTFHTQDCKIFWSIALRLPIMDDSIVAWKFCHVVHKVLREGHPLCLVRSQRHIKELDDIGKMWVHLKEGYGLMIRLYTNLLINKLKFHRRNPRFPGHLGVTPEELESIGGNDINNYFEITIEMFDYLDHILDLQQAVFGSLDMARSNSMTSAGQCRLAPLIPCIQDASKLYDYCAKNMFKLHSALPPDTLSGHRERFLKIFKRLKQFYESTSNLQYFKDLIAISPLPEYPPNFLRESDFGIYVTHEVVVPQEPEVDEPDITEGSLIDTSDSSEMREAPINSITLSTAAHQEMLNERDNLRAQCDKMRFELNKLMKDNDLKLNRMQDKITNLETELAKKESELVQERQDKEDLTNQAFAVAQSQDSEQKAKDEKFQKLKDFYCKLRDEHIVKLRDKAEVDKKLAHTEKKLEEVELTKNDLELKLKNVEEQLTKAQEQTAALSDLQMAELENLRKDKDLFHMESEILKKSVSDACKERDRLQVELSAVIQEKEELKKKSEEISFKLLECERQLDSVKESYDKKIKELVQVAIDDGIAIVNHAVHEVENPAVTALTCSPDYLRSLTEGCLEALKIATVLKNEDFDKIVASSRIAHRLATYILQGRATCNTSPDINFGEKMAEVCKSLGNEVVLLLQKLKAAGSTEQCVKGCVEKLEEIASLAESINLSLLGEKVGNLVEMLEGELAAMDKTIEEAARQIQEMLAKSREADSGIKLQVNEKILDACTGLMQAIRILVQKSRQLQDEIVAQGRGTASAKEFYKRNHRWTDGFISAAKAVGAAAQFLLTAADKVVTSNGKLEHLVVAAQEISASTAQLVVASRVKADRNSSNLKQLTTASKDVSKATGAVLATVKDCSQLMDEAETFDVSKLSLHQAKTQEMESQVKVLELEKELQQERYKLAALRKHNYQMAGESET